MASGFIGRNALAQDGMHAKEGGDAVQHTDSIEAGYWWAEQVAHRIVLDQRFGQGRNGFIHGLKKVQSAGGTQCTSK